MSYIQDNYIDADEKIIYSPTKSKIPLFWHWVYGILFSWLLLIPTIKAIKYTLAFKYKEYAVTNKKLIEKYGIVNVHCDEMRINRIENVTINKTFWGRLFNYGNICIKGTNRNNINFYGIIDPEAARKEINKITEELR